MLKSTMTYDAIQSGRSDAIRNIEASFARTLMNEGIKATIGFLSKEVSVTVESQKDHDNAKALLGKVDSMTYLRTDFYPEEEDMPAEWYLRFSY